MKASELMVGDWVLVKETNNPRKIEGTNDLLFHDDYIPIPLTEEILVKNGFERCDYNYKYFIIDDAIDLIAPKWRGGTEYYAYAWYQDEFDDLVQHIEICKCAYVHQLQHLLRLAGVQKEIEL